MEQAVFYLSGVSSRKRLFARARQSHWLGRAVTCVFALTSPLACSHSDDDGDTSTATDTGTQTSTDPRFAALAQAALRDLEANQATAASVAVWLDGKVQWVGGFGEAEPRLGRAPDENTLFMIGSDTKKLTAIGLLREVEENGLSLNSKLTDVVPELMPALAPALGEVTLHQLLSHQSGIADWVDVSTQSADADLRSVALGRFSANARQMTPAGLCFNYSNPNFALAGLLAETVDGRAWADMLAQDIFAPLGMHRSVARKAMVDENHALGIGYTQPMDMEAGVVSLAETWDAAFDRPAGLVWSTPSDQMRLAAFLVDGNSAVLSDAARRLIVAAHAPLCPDCERGAYGYGMFVVPGIDFGDTYYDVPMWSHGGNTLTHTSTFVVLPEQRFALSILSNGLGDDFSQSERVAIETLASLPAPVPAPAKPAFDRPLVQSLTGVYLEPDLGEVTITLEGERLRLQSPALDQSSVPYEPLLTFRTNRVWMFDVNGQTLDLRFVDAPDGQTYAVNRAFALRRPAQAPGAFESATAHEEQAFSQVRAWTQRIVQVPRMK